MDQWLAVLLAGALGGALTTFLPAGTDFPWPPFLQRFMQEGSFPSFLGNLLRNTVFGAVASFLVWGLADPTKDFSASGVQVGLVASAIIVGGAGGSVVNNLFRQARQSQEDSRVISNLRETLDMVGEESDGTG